VSHWNYRVVRVKYPRPKSLGDDELEEGFGIREVYYNDDETIYAMSKEDMAPYGETVEELKDNLEQMKEAFNAPVLDAAEVKFVDQAPMCECNKADCLECGAWQSMEDLDET
jgi:hypothetical protein